MDPRSFPQPKKHKETTNIGTYLFRKVSLNYNLKKMEKEVLKKNLQTGSDVEHPWEDE